MFERFTDPVTVVRLTQQGDLERLKKVITGGARVDRRTTYEPWMTPLDAACAARNLEACKILLKAGAPIFGSSIYEAIKADYSAALQLFHEQDAKFHQRFQQEANNHHNPRLNRWMSSFTALDFAISISSQECAAFLIEINARRHPTTKKHLQKCFAILIEDESFITTGGVNIDGLTEVTAGFYCAKCERFLS